MPADPIAATLTPIHVAALTAALNHQGDPPACLDDAVAAEEPFATAQRALAIAVSALLVAAPEQRLLVLHVEAAANALVAATTDTTWRLATQTAVLT